jgi:membrane-associated HD superfamily phosphohydrolase
MAIFSKNPEWFEIFLFVVLIIKLIFLFALLKTRIGKKRGISEKDLVYYENMEGLTHKLFFILMSLLVIYLFRPHHLFPKPVIVDGETKTFLFIFAILIILGIDYSEMKKELLFFRKN